MLFIYRNEPEFGFVRIIELLQIREAQLRLEQHEDIWLEYLEEACLNK